VCGLLKLTPVVVLYAFFSPFRSMNLYLLLLTVDGTYKGFLRTYSSIIYRTHHTS